jgi:hypothetical protein
VQQAYLTFEVRGLSGTVSSAKLRVYCLFPSAVSGGTIAALSSTPWTESTLTYANRPAFAVTVLSTMGPVDSGAWVEFDVTEAVTANGTLSFAITSDNTDGAGFASSESPNVPQLVVRLTP